MRIRVTDAGSRNANQNVRRSNLRNWNIRFLERFSDLHESHRSHFRFAIDIQCHFRRNPQMIKTRIAVVAIVMSFAATVASFAGNAQMGTWKLNEAKSKVAPGMGKNTTVVYAEQGDKIKITVEARIRMGNRRTPSGSENGTEKPTRPKETWRGTPPPTRW